MKELILLYYQNLVNLLFNKVMPVFYLTQALSLCILQQLVIQAVDMTGSALANSQAVWATKDIK
jgi:hypothetical protein